LKKVIDGRVFDTDDAGNTALLELASPIETLSLVRTANDSLFLTNAHTVGIPERSVMIQPFRSEKDARAWVANHFSADDFDTVFGIDTVEEA